MINKKPSSKVLIIYDHKLLLLLRDNDPSISDPNKWSLVGGEVNNGESYKQTIVREMNEEIGIAPKETRYLGRIKTQDGNLLAIFLVKPTLEEVAKIKIGNEGQKVQFFSLDEIKTINLSRNFRRYLDLYEKHLKDILNDKKAIEPKNQDSFN